MLKLFTQSSVIDLLLSHIMNCSQTILTKNHLSTSMTKNNLLRDNHLTTINSSMNFSTSNLSKNNSNNNPIKSNLSIKEGDNKQFRRRSIEKASNGSICKFLYPYYKKPRIAKLFSASLALTVLSKGFVTISPFYLKRAINSLLTSNTSSIRFFALSYLVKILGTIVGEIRNLQLNKISADIGIDFAKEMMSIICHMDYQEFKHNSEMIINSIHKTIVGLDRINRWVLGNALSNLVEIIMVSISLSSFFGKKYFIYTFLTYGIYMVASRKISNQRQLLFRERKYAELNAENKLTDIVNNIQTVKYFQGEERESESYSQLTAIVKEKDEKVMNSLALLNSTQSLILNSGIMMNMTSCVKDCLKGNMTPGDLFLLQGVFTQLMLPLHIIGVLMKELEESRIHLNYGIRLKQKQQASSLKESTTKKFIYKEGKIEIKDVSFNYNKKVSVLNNISAVFEPGKINCIMGESGQGKSTMFDLIYKLYNPKEGQIIIDGQDISQCDTISLRKHLTICPQNGFLFNDTIRHNICYGNPSLSNNEMLSVLKSVNLYHKIVELKREMMSNVGTLGGKLSGGERQRLLFARSLIKNGDIILFDEPTSNLDVENENAVFDLIRGSINKNKTVIMTGHKLSTIAKCDKIFVLNKGMIKESGSHEELMKMKGYYYNVVTKQLVTARATGQKPVKLL